MCVWEENVDASVALLDQDDEVDLQPYYEKRLPYQDEQFRMVSAGNQQSLDSSGVADESVTQLTSSETFARDLRLAQKKMALSLFLIGTVLAYPLCPSDQSGQHVEFHVLQNQEQPDTYIPNLDITLGAVAARIQCISDGTLGVCTTRDRVAHVQSCLSQTNQDT